MGGRLAMTASSQGIVNFWGADSMRTLEAHRGSICTAVFSPNGSMLLTASDADFAPKLWDVDSGRCLRVLKGHSDWIRSAAFLLDGTCVITSSGDETAKVWKVQSGEC